MASEGSVKRKVSFQSTGQDQERIPLRRSWKKSGSFSWDRSSAPEKKAKLKEVETTERYENYHTIDWLRETTLNRLRFRQVYNSSISRPLYAGAKRFQDACSVWLVLLLIGLAAGTCAGFIDTSAKWLIDLKFGVCTSRFWLNREACCLPSREANSHVDGHNCTGWKSWDKLLNATISDFAVQYIMYVAIALCFSTTAAILVHFFAPLAAGSGIPEVKTILGGFIIRGFLGKMVLVIKCITASLAVSSNLSLGKEGPLVHISACCGNVFAHLFPKYGQNEANKREVLSAAAAAGVSVAFGVPVGGVLFSLEEVSYYFPMKTLWRSFFCAMVAAFVLRSLNPYGSNTENFVLFYVTYDRPWIMFELIPFALLGILGGAFGAAFVRANLWWCKVRKTTRLRHHPILEVMFITIVTTAIAFHNPYTRMDATSMINMLVQECGPALKGDLCDYHIVPQNHSSGLHPSNKVQPIGELGEGLKTAAGQLALAFLFKCIITVFTFGLKIPTGLFIPSLGIGALMGRLMGIGIEQLVYTFPDSPLWESRCRSSEHNCITPGLYAMVGAASMLGGVTRMTISLVVVVYELTGGLAYIVPLMLAAMFSKWVGDALSREGIYAGHIRLNRYPYLNDDEELTHATLAYSVMRPKADDPPLTVVTQENMTVQDLDALIKTTKFKGFPVVTSSDSERLVGYLYRRDLIIALANARSRSENVVNSSKVYFTLEPSAPEPTRNPMPVQLFNIVDLGPITVTDHTPLDIVIDLFAKLGVRQILVTHNGQLLGLITKKDVLRHIAELHGEDPSLFD